MKSRIFTTMILGIFGILLLISLVSAIDLQVSSKQISNSVITDLNEPAIFELTMTNNEDSDSFQIYSLVGINIIPSESFTIVSGETKTIRIYLTPQEGLTTRETPFPFVYHIKNSKGEIQKESLTISIMNLERSISIIPGNINPQSDRLSIELKNRATYDFDNIELKFISVFFNDYETTASLKSLETKNLDIPLDRGKVKVLDAGQYLLKAQIEIKGKSADKEAVIRFVEQPNIDEKKLSEGMIIRRTEITKKNIGNVKEKVTISIEKNFVSYLFTTTNLPPTRANMQGFRRIYIWEKELIPDDELNVIITTNWFFPILILIAIIIVIVLIKKYLEKDFIFRKNVSFVRTKGGEFALRVSLKIKAKKYTERINITDKLPHLVNLYEKFGAVPPHKVDLHNKRVEWNIESMNTGEERIFSYIIYSHKIGVVGRFELPSAKAVYERNGKIKEITSNRAFFINEPKKGI